MLFKSKQRKAGERIVRELGSALNYEVWTPKQRETDGLICLEAACAFPGTDIFIVPGKSHWELLIAESNEVVRQEELVPLSATAKDLFAFLDARFFFILNSRSPSEYAAVSVGTVWFNTREMLGNYSGSHEARLATILLLITMGPDGVNSEYAEMIAGAEDIAKESAELFGDDYSNYIKMMHDWRDRKGL